MKLNPSDLAHQDIDVELAKAKHVADVMDIFIKALEPKFTETCCQRCGRRLSLPGHQDPNANWVCTNCTDMDKPDANYSHGWSI